MKKQRFWALLRLRLCLILATVLSSCMVLKPTETTTTSGRTYRLTVDIRPGADLSKLFNALSGIGFEAINDIPGLQDQDTQMTILIKVNSEAQLNRISLELSTSGIRIVNLVRQAD